MLASTLATIHNERYIIRLLDRVRDSIGGGEFYALQTEVLGSLGSH
jgi:queuine tRNA-ribosyltransferase